MSYNRVGDMQNQYTLSMVVLAWCLLPLTTVLATILSAYSYGQFVIYKATPSSQKRKVLITGSSSASIALARTLRALGNDVIGADYHRFPFISTARFSNAYRSFHNLYKEGKWQPPKRKMVLEGFGVRIEVTVSPPRFWHTRPSFGFKQDIIVLIEREKPDLWIPCPSSHNIGAEEVAKATEAVRRRALCKVLQAEEDTAEMLTDESAFGEYVEQLETGIKVPEFKIVTSRDEVHKLLAAYPDLSWELEYSPQSPTSGSETAKEEEEEIELNDEKSKRRWTWPVPPKSSVNETYLKNLPSPPATKLVVPLRSKNATYHTIAGMTISPEHLWTMREKISGQAITLHLLIVRNRLRAMEACVLRGGDNSGLQEAELVPSTSLLHKPLSHFAEAFTASLPDDTSSFLSVDVIVSATATTMGVINTIFPTSCSVGVHATTPLLMAGSLEQREKIARAIMDMATPTSPKKSGKRKSVESNGSTLTPVKSPPEMTTSTRVLGTYSCYPALLHLVVVPFFSLFTRTCTLQHFLQSTLTFCEKCLLWQDDLYSIRDPWPFWWEWNIKVPFLYLADRFKN